MKSSPNLRQRIESLPTPMLVALCLVYLISPIDALPFIPIDDWVVFGWTSWTVFKRAMAAAARSARASDGPGPFVPEEGVRASS